MRESLFNPAVKSAAVIDHHFDDGIPGKPLHLMIPGGLIALLSLGAFAYLQWQSWQHVIEHAQAVQAQTLSAIGYVVGVFLFSYGYELYDFSEALKLTVIVVLVTVLAVVIVLALVAVAKDLFKRGSSSSSASSSTGPAIAPDASVVAAPSIVTRVNSRLAGDALYVASGVYDGALEARATAPDEPTPVICAQCQTSFEPTDNNGACPSCGLAAPLSGT